MDTCEILIGRYTFSGTTDPISQGTNYLHQLLLNCEAALKSLSLSSVLLMEEKGDFLKIISLDMFVPKFIELHPG